MLALGDQVLDRIQLLVLRLHDDAALVLVVLAELDEAVDFREHGGLLRLARLEQLRHARQTAGDVAGLGAFGRNTREHVAGFHLGAIFDRQNGVDRKRITRLAAWQRDRLALLVDDDDGRPQVLGLGARAAGIDDDPVGHAGLFVGHFLDGNADDEVLVLHDAVDVGKHRQRVRIPFGQAIAALHGRSLVRLCSFAP